MAAEQVLGLSYEELEAATVFAGRAVPERTRFETSSYVSCPQWGLNLVLDKNRVGAVHLFAGDAAYQRFEGVLPLALSFEMSRTQVRARLGAPAASGERQHVPILGEMPTWDLFEQANYALHVQYTLDAQALTLVTLMRLDVAEQLKP